MSTPAEQAADAITNATNDDWRTDGPMTAIGDALDQGATTQDINDALNTQ